MNKTCLYTHYSCECVCLWTSRTHSSSCRPSISRALAEESSVADRTFCCRRESLCRY